ncbi:MAG: nitroreductase family protein [Clostridia bacterium]|nr:nitroreductase family protein [Clostridia bacterium]MBQ8428516.1 nitroreductase family protein [Clostridia bacterium]MBQ8429989.1 nitroreductase family protein [Clostridia bacterium]
MEAIENLLTRKSIKSYKPDPVPKALIEKVIEAGLEAPSGLNKQSPIILAVTDRQVRDELSKLNAGKDPFFRADPFYGAPVVLVVLADKSVPTYLYDGSLVMENLLLAAHALGLGACWIHRAKETFDMPEGKALLEKIGLKGDYEGIGNCILGYANVEPEKKPRKANRTYWIE